MTSPTPAGYPDWGRQFSQSDIILANDVYNPAPNLALGPFYVGGIPFVAVRLSLDVGRLDMRFTWLGSNGVGPVVGQDCVRLTAGQEAVEVLPVGGPWLTISATATIVPCNLDTAIVMAPTGAVRTGVSGTEQILFSVAGAAIAALGTATIVPSRVRSGMAHFAAAVGNTGWNARLEYMDTLGAWNFLAEVETDPVRSPSLVFIPPVPVRCVIVNRLAAASTYNAALSIRPGYGGA